MSFIGLTLVVLVVFAVCSLIMAVGAIIKGKTFKSCGCGSIKFRGEIIRCPGCTDGGDGECKVEQEQRPVQMP